MNEEQCPTQAELELDREAEEALRSIQQVKQNAPENNEDDDFEWEETDDDRQQEQDEAEMLAQLLSVDLGTQGGKPIQAPTHHRHLPTITNVMIEEQKGPVAITGQISPRKTQQKLNSPTNRSETSPTADQSPNSKDESPHKKPVQKTVSPPSGRPKPRFMSNKSKVPAGLRKLPSPPTNLQQAMMEWDMVETVHPGNESAVRTSPLVTFLDALAHFQTADYIDQHLSHIKPTIRHRGCSAVGHALFGPRKMKKSLHNDRNLIFAMALCMFDNDIEMHGFVLQTIYKKLTGTKLDCPRFGNHWELIGFQGVDPSTDLRGCGFLGLMTALHFITNPSTQSLALAVYKLSQHEIQNFPFLVMSINITRITLHALREGVLNKECNNRDQVFEVFNEYFVAVYCKVYQIWKLQRKTIGDSGFVLKEVEKLVKKEPQALFRNLQRALADKKTIIFVDDNKDNLVNKMNSFAGVCDLQGDEDDDVHLV